jgi:hypothetical protein
MLHSRVSGRTTASRRPRRASRRALVGLAHLGGVFGEKACLVAGRQRPARRRGRPSIMDQPDPAEAVRMLDLMLAFFGDGETWTHGTLSDGRGGAVPARGGPINFS